MKKSMTAVFITLLAGTLFFGCASMEKAKAQDKNKVAAYIQQVKKFLKGKPTNNASFAGKTRRGNEIQKELSDLEKITRNKDLLLDKKKEIKTKLLALQKEMNVCAQFFSKFDSIPIRQNQVENYFQRIES